MHNNLRSEYVLMKHIKKIEKERKGKKKNLKIF